VTDRPLAVQTSLGTMLNMKNSPEIGTRNEDKSTINMLHRRSLPNMARLHIIDVGSCPFVQDIHSAVALPVSPSHLSTTILPGCRLMFNNGSSSAPTSPSAPTRVPAASAQHNTTDNHFGMVPHSHGSVSSYVPWGQPTSPQTLHLTPQQLTATHRKTPSAASLSIVSAATASKTQQHTAKVCDTLQHTGTVPSVVSLSTVSTATGMKTDSGLGKLESHDDRDKNEFRFPYSPRGEGGGGERARDETSKTPLLADVQQIVANGLVTQKSPRDTQQVATSEVETDTITQDRDSSGRDSTPTRESARAHESGAISEHDQEKEQETGRRDGEKGNSIFFFILFSFLCMFWRWDFGLVWRG